MRRVLVMGPPGSGKSTLARGLGTKLGLAVHHLDQSYWNSGWVATSSEAFAADVFKMTRDDKWIIEGNYAATLGPRLDRADTIVYLDFPTYICLPRTIWRAISHRGRVRSDMPPGCPEGLNIGFFWFVALWNRRNRTRSLKRIDTFAGRSVVLRTVRDIAQFIAHSG